MTFQIVSLMTPMLPIPVQGTGDNLDTARRCAERIALVIKKINRPTADGHQVAWANFLWAQEEARRRVRIGLSGSSPMCFDNRYGN